MEMMLKKVMILFVILLGIAGCLPKPEPRTGDFNAAVIDSLTGEGVPGANVDIGDRKEKTDLKGQFSLADLAPGDYQVQITREWYESKNVTYNHLGKPDLVCFYLKPPGLSGRIYYSFEEGGNKEIYELTLEDRTVKRFLGLSLSAETNPACSESKKLVVESTLNKVSSILIYDISKENFGPILLRDSIFGEHPTINKNGEKMAFKSNGKIIKYDLVNNLEIESYDRAGWNPVISPDGNMVAYTSGDYTKLYIYINKSIFHEFTPGENYKLNNPCWSPDGTKIAFEAYADSEGQRAIYYITVDSLDSGKRQITVPSGEKEQHKHPSWGEDNIIYFSGNIIYSSRSDIYAVKFDDGSQWIMVSKGSGSKDYPCWGN